MNTSFRVEYRRAGRVSTWQTNLGLNELCEFIRNCNAYDREILSVSPLPVEGSTS